MKENYNDDASWNWGTRKTCLNHEIMENFGVYLASCCPNMNEGGFKESWCWLK